ncbi:MAG: TIGR01777 family protein [Actinomycetia bacterium]|nr:TIGR01777 family protein [Actinomycetes bacterium]
MRIAITGSSGLIGTALARHLREDGHEVVPVVRRPPGDNEIGWSVDENRIEDNAFDGLDAIVHLAGAGIGDRRWTARYKRELLNSRIVGTSLVAEAARTAANPPSTLLSGSAIGFYGSSLTSSFDESDGAGEGFLADLCVAWEGAAASAETEATRLAFLRTGIVMSPKGGVLKKQLPLFKYGLGGRMGDGQQWLSWISIHDVVGAIGHLLTSEVTGPVNLTAPSPVTNARFTKNLGEVLGRPTVLPVPKLGPKLLLGGELADNLLFSGQKVLPTVLQRDGYEFVHPDIEAALRGVLAR